MTTLPKAIQDVEDADCEQLIAAAISDRKVHPDRADDYRRLYAASPVIMRKLLTAPVLEGGLRAGVAAPAPTEDAYPAGWVQQPGSGGVTTEDGDVEPTRAAEPGRTPGITVEP